VGVYIYKLQAEKNATAAIKELDQAIATFKDGDFKRVLEYDERLNRTQFLIDNHISISSLIKILSAATAQTVQFKTLEISRTDTKTVEVKGALKTSSLDGVLFQRGLYKATTKIADTAFKQIVLVAPAAAAEKITDLKNEVELTAEFNFSAGEILYTPLSLVSSGSLVEPASAVGTAITSGSDAERDSAVSQTNDDII